MPYCYLSYILTNKTPQYGGKNSIEILVNDSINKGDNSNSKYLKFPNHSGTHIDFPLHFSNSGKSINDYEPGFWIFNYPYIVYIDINPDEIICNSHFNQHIPEETDFLIIHSGFSIFRDTDKYWKNNPGLHPDLAAFIKVKCPRIKVIGIDFISISSFQNRTLGREAHREFLLENDILIIEDMNLSMLPSKIKKITALPLLADKLDGSPINILAKYE